MFDRYRPSGGSSPAAIALLVAAAAAAGAAAWVYQTVVDWVPLIYVAFLVTMGFGIALGWTARFVVERGRVRSPALGAAVVVVLVAAGWAASFHWAHRTFVHDVRDAARAQGAEVTDDDVDRAVGFDDYVDARVASGWQVGRSGSGLPLSGVVVWLVWATELGILGALAWARSGRRWEHPYCEACGAWASTTALPPSVGGRAGPVADAIERGDLRAAVAPPTLPSASTVLTYDLHACPSCDEAAWLDVADHRVTADAKGKTKTTTVAVARGVALTPAQRREAVEARAAAARAEEAARDEAARAGAPEAPRA